jgi:hypothetical protein
LTIEVRQSNANIGLGKTALWSNSGRIAPLTSPHGRGGECRASIAGTGDRDELGSDRGQLAALQRQAAAQLGQAQLAARLQERYGFARSEAEREIGAWIRCQRHAA